MGGESVMANKLLSQSEKMAAEIENTPQNNVEELIKTKDDNFCIPSDSPFNVFLLCQPLYVDEDIENNIWMKKLGNGPDSEIDKDKFMGEWYNLYNLLATDSLVYLIPPIPGLQDQTYVNCMAYLPHYKEEPTIILSNFTAEGRAGEEKAAEYLLSKLGYSCIQSPYKFEGDAELKYFKDDIYFGGCGVRTQKETYEWIMKQYGGNIVILESKDEYLYHLDCQLFVLNKDNILVCDTFGKENIKKIEKYANVELVSRNDCMECVCNSIKVGDIILNASSFQFMNNRDKDYKKEWHKNERINEICQRLGLELMYIPMEEAGKSGAALSCFCGRLNFWR